jgi:acyl-CoA synthetase (NDP forming)
VRVLSSKEFDGLAKMLNPNAVAIVGASNDLTKPGGRLMQYALRHGQSARLFPVNPNRPEVMGKKAYPRVTQIPGEVDLACIAVPNQNVLSVVQDCAEKRVKFIIVFSSGYAEIGKREEQKELVETARKGGSRLMGPNCQGIISPANDMVACYHACLDGTPVKGEIGLVTQSGALGGYLCGALWERKIGISHFISTGNESDLEVTDFLEYLAKEDNTRVIALFLEGVRNGEKFRGAAELALQMKKPIISLKTGRSEKGRISALTHTGAITGSDQVYDALFRQLGIIRVKTLEELTDGAMALAYQPLPKGNGVAFLSPSGAACSIVSDMSEEVGLKVADISEETVQKIKTFLPDMAVSKNPLDVVYVYGNPNARTMIGDIIETMAKDPSVDIIIPGITIGGPVADELIEYSMESIRKVREQTGKPVLYWWAIDHKTLSAGEKKFSENRVPLYSSPERAVIAASVMWRYAQFIKRQKT